MSEEFQRYLIFSVNGREWAFKPEDLEGISKEKIVPWENPSKEDCHIKGSLIWEGQEIPVLDAHNLDIFSPRKDNIRTGEGDNSPDEEKPLQEVEFNQSLNKIIQPCINRILIIRNSPFPIGLTVDCVRGIFVSKGTALLINPEDLLRYCRQGRIKEPVYEKNKKSLDKPGIQQEREEKMFLHVVLANSSFALALEEIREVAVLEHITPIPSLPWAIAGIGERNGEIFSIIRLHRLFKLELPQKVSHNVVITKNIPYTTALSVEKIKGVIRVEKEKILTKPPGEFFKGIVSGKQGDIPIPDIKKILYDDIFYRYFQDKKSEGNSNGSKG